ncbi:MAG: ABC transporter substrate-binding protein [Acetobacteraceae bacterium]|nr:ABC transporter substrate-binding protein [Acetobacteraceae bacterium]
MIATRRSVLTLLAAAALPLKARAAAEAIRLGLLHTLSPAPFFIAQERGLFRDQGLDVSFRFFEAAQPIAAAAVAGDIDLGVTALTGGFFSLASKGALRVIGGGLHERPGWEGSAILVSAKAYAAGLTSVDKLPGHSFAITQYGSSFHYMLGRIAEAAKFDLSRVTLRPLQTVPNMLAALRTGQVDATIAIASQAKPLVASGEAHILAWAGDLVPYQITALFTTARMIAERPDALRRFALAYRKGVAVYRAAFFRRGPDNAPIRDAETDVAVKDIEKYVFTGDPNAAQRIIEGVGSYDPDGALDAADVAAQLGWFEAHGMVKGETDPKAIIDTRFLPVLGDD